MMIDGWKVTSSIRFLETDMKQDFNSLDYDTKIKILKSWATKCTKVAGYEIISMKESKEH